MTKQCRVVRVAAGATGRFTNKIWASIVTETIEFSRPVTHSFASLDWPTKGPAGEQAGGRSLAATDREYFQLFAEINQSKYFCWQLLCTQISICEQPRSLRFIFAYCATVYFALFLM